MWRGACIWIGIPSRISTKLVPAQAGIYMREQLRLAGPPSPRVIGIDEVSIKKRHVYRIVVSDPRLRGDKP